MTRYCGERELEHRLLRVVLHSADVLPEVVSLYLKEIIEIDNSDAKEYALKDYQPLVDKIPKDYVDFACNVLIADIEQIQEEHSKYASQMIGDSFDLEIYNGVYKLGIADNEEFFPPAHIQGPFLYLLNKNEDEGLRLVQTLTNTAVTRWREFQQGRYNRLLGANKTPIPTLIDLPSGSHEFWGDEQVYQWYRPHSIGPNVVKSGLMALEVWIEEQIEKDRNSEELFNKILSGSKCVAILGICLGIALAYPEKCLKAALPIACSPAVLRMDVNRYASDCRGPSNFDFFDVFGLYKHIQKAQDERNRRPQRFLDIRSLAILYIHSADNAISGKFENAISQFLDDLPFLFEEEKKDQELVKSLHRKMKRFQIYGNRSNYRIKSIDDRLQIWFDPPEHIKKIDEFELKPLVESQRLFTLSYWADKSIEKGDAAEGMTLECAVEVAKEFQKQGDFSVPYDLSNFPDVLRLQTIAGVAAAVLIVDYQRAKELDLVDWCKEILLSAACMPYDGIYTEETIIPMNPKVFAGRGLCVIAAHFEEAYKNLGTYILSLVCDPYVETVESVLTGLRDVWKVDESLCWNALCLGLSLCLCPKKLALDRSEMRLKNRYKWLQHNFSKYLKKYNKNIIPKLPRIPQSERELIFNWELALQLISCLHLSDMVKNPEYKCKAQLLLLADDLLSWIIEKNVPIAEKTHLTCESPPLFANMGIMSWISKLSKELSHEETKLHILNPIKKTWPEAPDLTENLLRGYINNHIAFVDAPSEKSQTSWREICNWVLDSPIINKIENSDYTDKKLAQVLSTIIFVGIGDPLIKKEWTHIMLFFDIFDKWVYRVGHNSNMYTYLVEILNGPGKGFSLEITLNWLHYCAINSSNIQDFWNKNRNGEMTASLLQKEWKEFPDQILNNPTNLQIYSLIIDSLVAAGISSAAMLQQELDSR